MFSINRKERNTKNIFQKKCDFHFFIRFIYIFYFETSKKNKTYKRDISHFPVVSLPLGLPMLLFLTGAPRCGHVAWRRETPEVHQSKSSSFIMFLEDMPVR